MATTLEALHRLQDIELQLSAIKQKLSSKQRSVTAHTHRLNSLGEDIARQHENVQRQQVEADRLDLEVKSREAEVTKLRTALNTARTNKEYAAILTQINTDKADNAKLEDRILQILAKVDEMRTEAKKLDEQREQEMRRLAQLQNEHDDLKRETGSKVQQLQAEREEAADGVPPTVLQTFERVAERYDGEAMAMVVRTNPRREEFICQGCNMTVTLEKVNALITRDEVQQCQSCGRILYLQEAPTRQQT